MVRPDFLSFSFNEPNEHALRTLLPLLLLVCACNANAAERAIPNTLEEAFASLDQSLNAGERRRFMSLPEDEAVTEAHFGLGMYVRNTWFRSGHSGMIKTFLDAGAGSMDDMSSMVLHSYWRYLNGRPVRLQEQGACYVRWWNEQKRLYEQASANKSESYPSPGFSCPN